MICVFVYLSSKTLHLLSKTFFLTTRRKCFSRLVVMVNHCSWVMYFWFVFFCICYLKLIFWPRGESAFLGCDGESLQLGGVFMIRPVTDRICHFVTRGHGGHQAQGPSKGNGPKSSGRQSLFLFKTLGERSSQNLGEVALSNYLSLSLVKRRPQSFSDIKQSNRKREKEKDAAGMDWTKQSLECCSQHGACWNQDGI